MKTQSPLMHGRVESRLWNKRTEVMSLLIIALTIMVAQYMPVYATKPAISAEDQNLVTSIYNGLEKVYSILYKAVLPIAGVCVAGCALTIWLGGEKGIEKAKRILLFTVMGMVIVFIAPAIVVTAHKCISYSRSFPTTQLNQVTGLADTVTRIWNIAEYIVLPLAGLSVAYGGMCFFGIDILSQLALDRQIEKGKTIIRTTLVAVLCFYLIPTVLVLAVNTFSGSGWAPTSPTPTP